VTYNLSILDFGFWINGNAEAGRIEQYESGLPNQQSASNPKSKI
jgi:hypothetical protein